MTKRKSEIPIFHFSMGMTFFNGNLVEMGPEIV